MIDVALGPIASHPEPRKAISAIVTSVNFNSDVTLTIVTSGYFASLCLSSPIYFVSE